MAEYEYPNTENPDLDGMINAILLKPWEPKIDYLFYDPETLYLGVGYNEALTGEEKTELNTIVAEYSGGE